MERGSRNRLAETPRRHRACRWQRSLRRRERDGALWPRLYDRDRLGAGSKQSACPPAASTDSQRHMACRPVLLDWTVGAFRLGVRDCDGALAGGPAALASCPRSTANALGGAIGRSRRVPRWLGNRASQATASAIGSRISVWCVGFSYGSLPSTLDTIDPHAFLQWRDQRERK